MPLDACLRRTCECPGDQVRTPTGGASSGVDRGEQTVFHSGRYEGFQAACVRYPDRGLIVILLTNVIVDEGDAGWYTHIQDDIEMAMCSDEPAQDL